MAFENCSFSGTGATLLDASVGVVTITNSRIAGGSDQLETHFARLSITDVDFHRVGDDAISVEGGSAVLQKIAVDGREGAGSSVNQHPRWRTP